MRRRRPQISLVRVHQFLGFGPQASEAHEASTSTNSCNTFVVYNRPGPMKRGCPRMLASGAQDTSAPTNPRVGIWGSVHDTPCLLSGRLPLRFFTCWMACLNIVFCILRKYNATPPPADRGHPGAEQQSVSPELLRVQATMSQNDCRIRHNAKLISEKR